MDLDKRIDSIDCILNPFSDTSRANLYVGKTGYFAQNFEDFSDLSIRHHGTLELIAEHPSNPFLYRIKESGALYKYFLPDNAVNSTEPRFRPFNLTEFMNKFPMGTTITFRHKDETNYWRLIFIGYLAESNGSMDVCIGCDWYSFKELAEEFEYRNESGEWLDFGVKEL